MSVYLFKMRRQFRSKYGASCLTDYYASVYAFTPRTHIVVAATKAAVGGAVNADHANTFRFFARESSRHAVGSLDQAYLLQ
jgi:hypothetical protein